MRNLTFVLFILSISLSATSQVLVDNSLNAEEALEVLLGEGVSVSNVTMSGNMNQVGSFNGAASNLNMAEGVILGTGNVNFAETGADGNGSGGNDEGGGSLGGGNFGANDADLDDLSTVATNDALILEFDFVPSGDSIKFFYIFGSEEYNEYVCGTVNDAFGFFLSGPGIDGPFSNDAINLAKVPGTDIPVTINTVNNGNVGNSGALNNCEQVSDQWDENSAYFIDNSNYNGNDAVQFDGYTVPLLAEAEVQCGETYHIKIAIADGGDTSWDSAVFLQEGSFNSTSIDITGNLGTSLNDSTIYEGCGLAEIIFTRSTGLYETLTLDVEYGGTATVVDDYDPLPAEVFFEIDQEEAFLNVNTLLDDVVEGLEYIEFTINTTDCNAFSTSFRLYISDDPLAQMMLGNEPFCPGDDVVLSSVVTGGVPPYSFEWNTGETDAVIIRNPMITTTYSLVTSDACGNEVTEEITIEVPPIIPFELDIPTTIDLNCAGIATIESNVTGGIETYIYSWFVDGEAHSSNPNFTEYFDMDAVVTLRVDDACGLTIEESVDINVVEHPPLVVSLTPDSVICHGTTINLVSSAEGGFGEYQIEWSPTDETSATNSVRPNITQSYTVTYTDECGVIDSTSTLVTVHDIEASFNFDQLVGTEFQFNNTSEDVDIFLWNFGDGQSSEEENPQHTYENMVDYMPVELVVTSEAGCQDSVIHLVPPPLNFFIPNAFTPDNDGLNEVFEFYINGADRFEFTVFNRWGEIVFRTIEPGVFWNGSVNGGEYYVPDGVYAWALEVRGFSANAERYTGTVTVVR